MSWWTDTPKGRRAMEALVGGEFLPAGEIVIHLRMTNDMRLAAAMRFLDAHVPHWTTRSWTKSSGGRCVEVNAQFGHGPSLVNTLGSGDTREWALIEAVCKVLDLESRKATNQLLRKLERFETLSAKSKLVVQGKDQS